VQKPRNGSDDRLRPLRLHAGELCYKAARRDDLCRIDPNIHTEVGRASADRHHHIFGGSIACTFTQAVNAGIYPFRSVTQSFQGISNGKPKIVMAMGGDTDVRELALHIGNEPAKLPW